MAREDWWSKIGLLMLFVFAWLVWNFWGANWTPPWSPFSNGDFFIFYSAGKAWLQHQNPYPQLPVYGQPEFFYPPTSLLLFGLYAIFSFDVAKDLWFITYMSAFAAAAVASIYTVEGERRRWFGLIVLLLVLASYPFQNQMLTGQSDLLMASLTVLSLISQRRGHDSLSALLLSSATLLKGPPVLLLIYFVLYHRDVKYLLRFILATAAIIGVSLIAIPVQLYGYYATDLVPRLMISAGGLHQSAVSYLAIIGVNYLSPIVSVVGVLLFMSFAVYVGASKRRATGRSFLCDDAMFLMNILVYLLVGPQISPYSYIWVILPLALVLSHLLIVQNVRLGYLVLMSFEAFLLSSNIYLSFNLLVPNQLPYPVNVAGALMMAVSLVPIFVKPGSRLISHDVSSRT